MNSIEKNNNKIIVILGPTSSGKSAVAIKLAKKFNGEIISADSRQVYRGLDIGTGKICGIWNAKNKTLISEKIVHYGINIASSKTEYNVAKFKKYADKIILDILKRKKVPIICGGTGFWVKSVLDNIVYPEVKPDPILRNILCNKSAEELFLMLQKLDPERAKDIDAKNTVRLIRAIEICKAIGKVPKIKHANSISSTKIKNLQIKFLQIGIHLSKEKLHINIKKRLTQRIKQGMIQEIKKLHKENKLSWKKIESFGLGYKLIPKHLKGEIKTEKELFEKIYQAEKKYAKRQMTWFQKDQRIIWLREYDSIQKKAENFLVKHFRFQ